MCELVKVDLTHPRKIFRELECVMYFAAYRCHGAENPLMRGKKLQVFQQQD